MITYLIHDVGRTDRESSVAEALRQIPSLTVITPVPARTPVVSCNKTHRDAWHRGLLSVGHDEAICVLEDDVQFTPAWTTDVWLQCEAWLTHSSYDLLLGGVSHGGNPVPVSEPTFTTMLEIGRFTATHCYLLKPSAVPVLLAQQDTKHADAALSDAEIRRVVIVPFVATQWPGRSDIRMITVNDDWTFIQAEHRLKKVLGLADGRPVRHA